MNIEATLKACRDELARQQDMDVLATSEPWLQFGKQVRNEAAPGKKTLGYIVAGTGSAVCNCLGGHYCGRTSPHGKELTAQAEANAAFICLSRNLNPARLAIVKHLLSLNDENDSTTLAAVLLGVLTP